MEYNLLEFPGASRDRASYQEYHARPEYAMRIKQKIQQGAFSWNRMIEKIIRHILALPEQVTRDMYDVYANYETTPPTIRVELLDVSLIQAFLAKWGDQSCIEIDLHWYVDLIIPSIVNPYFDWEAYGDMSLTMLDRSDNSRSASGCRKSKTILEATLLELSRRVSEVVGDCCLKE